MGLILQGPYASGVEGEDEGPDKVGAERGNDHASQHRKEAQRNAAQGQLPSPEPEGGNPNEEQDGERHEGDGPSLGVVDQEPEDVEVDLIGGFRAVQAHVAEMVREREGIGAHVLQAPFV
jgi:hypothetical protein